MKKLVSIFLIVIMLLSAAPLAGLADLDLSGNFALKADALASTGKCGDNVTWTYDSSTKTLTISGRGDMEDFDFNDSPFYASSIKTVIIKNGVTSIGADAFEYCKSLTSVTIPNSVTSIGIEAFSGCGSLTSVTIGNGVKSIRDSAFEECRSLKSVTIPDSVTSIGDSAFSDCGNLTSVTIGKGVKSIGDDAFFGCSSLKSITIPNSVTSIGIEAFSGCGSLTSVTIGNGVKSIRDSAFEECRSLKSVTIGNGVTSIGEFAFYYCCSLTSVTIPESVTSIGEFAFYYCCSLTSVTIPESVTSIGGSAFSGCSSLKSITIPNSVAYIGEGAFKGCSSLTSVTIGNSLKSIGKSAFYKCKELNNVFFSGNEADWEKIKIGKENDYLKKARKHYNTSGKEHQKGWETVDRVIPATLTKDGEYHSEVCSVCGTEWGGCWVIDKASNVSLSKTEYNYNGDIKRPGIYVKDSEGYKIYKEYYTEKWSNKNSKAPGKYTVTVTFKGLYSGKKTLTYKIFPVVKLKESTLLLYIGESKKLNLSVKPSSTKITWKSSDKSVAKVASDGTVKALKKGTAKITASYKFDGKITNLTCKVTVKKQVVKLDKKSLNLEQGKTYTLKATKDPSKAKLSWKSSNPAVASVNSSGTVTAKALGKATITVKNGPASAKCTVTVNKKKVSVLKGKTINLSSYVKNIPSYGKGTWSSSNRSVATVNSKGVVSGKTAGNCVITFKAKDGTKYVFDLAVKNWVTTKVVYGEQYSHSTGWIIYFTNNTNKNITYVECKLYQYDNRGYKINTDTEDFYLNNTIKANGGTNASVELDRDTRSVSVQIKKVWFSDGTTYKP